MAGRTLYLQMSSPGAALTVAPLSHSLISEGTQMKKTVWISKYALSTGLTEHKVEIRDGAAYPGAPFPSFVGFAMGKDAHETREAAVAAAEAARKKKLIALKKQIAKIECLKF